MCGTSFSFEHSLKMILQTSILTVRTSSSVPAQRTISFFVCVSLLSAIPYVTVRYLAAAFACFLFCSHAYTHFGPLVRPHKFFLSFVDLFTFWTRVIWNGLFLWEKVEFADIKFAALCLLPHKFSEGHRVDFRHFFDKHSSSRPKNHKNQRNSTILGFFFFATFCSPSCPSPSLFALSSRAFLLPVPTFSSSFFRGSTLFTHQTLAYCVFSLIWFLS